jgi:hypothetical protein
MATHSNRIFYSYHTQGRLEFTFFRQIRAKHLEGPAREDFAKLCGTPLLRRFRVSQMVAAIFGTGALFG